MLNPNRCAARDKTMNAIVGVIVMSSAWRMANAAVTTRRHAPVSLNPY